MSNKVRIITNTDPAKGETVFNCNPNLVHYVIPHNDPLWHDFRTIGAMGYPGGWGASEVHKTLRVEKEDYRPVLPELIEWKSGISKPTTKMTKFMMMGILMEPVILDIWTYYDGLHETYPDNFAVRQRKREYGTVGAYIVNKKMPWLFVSLDAYIKKGYSSLLGTVLNYNCPLEVKTVGFQAARQQEHGIPLRYVYQVQQQMLVTETDYAEMAILEAGNTFKVEYFEANQQIQEAILESTYKEWQLILKLREMKEERDSLRLSGHFDKAEEIDSHIQSALPLPSSGDGYSEYYSEKHIGKQVVSGSMEMYRLVRKRSNLKQAIKQLESQADLIENVFRDSFVKNKAEVIDFESLGSVIYRKKSNGKNLYPDFSTIKEKADSSKYEQIVKQIIKELK